MSPSSNQKIFSLRGGWKITALKLLFEVEITARDVRYCRDYEIVLHPEKYATHTANAIYIREDLNIISHIWNMERRMRESMVGLNR
jgi:hypothetical protein